MDTDIALIHETLSVICTASPKMAGFADPNINPLNYIHPLKYNLIEGALHKLFINRKPSCAH